MSYTINPNAKNKWARNAENTMDLSLETDASSVYLDNGRTLEQEIGEGSMISNVATVDTAMSKVINGTLDGAYESGVMYGRSLVNNNNNKFKEIAFNATNTTQATNYALLLDNVAGCPDLNITMVAGKKYLILEKWTISSTTGNGHTIQPKIIDKNGGVTYLSGNGQVKGIGTFTLKRTFTPTVDVDKFYFAITNGPGATVSGTFHYGMIMEYQEGMENWDIPFFTGLCDVKMPILRNTGKNLFDGNLEDGALDSSGMPVEYENRKRTGFIKIKQGETYTISGCTIARWCFYTPEKEFITTNTTQTTKPAPMDGYIRFSIQTNFTHDNIQLEESSSATSDEDHKTNILHTPEIVTLRSLPNDVRDELNLKTGEYIKRIGEVVFDGDEDWVNIQTNMTENPFFELHKIYDAIPTSYGDKLRCNKILPTRGGGISYANDAKGISILGNKEVRIRTEESINGQTLAEFKQWLSQNPVTVQYQLETPIVTTIELLSVPFAYENGHIILESGFEGQSLLPTLEYSTVINKTGLIENVAKTIQRQEKQLTKLEQMLIQNIINLDYNNTLLTLKNEMEEML